MASVEFPSHLRYASSLSSGRLSRTPKEMHMSCTRNDGSNVYVRHPHAHTKTLEQLFRFYRPMLGLPPSVPPSDTAADLHRLSPGNHAGVARDDTVNNDPSGCVIIYRALLCHCADRNNVYKGLRDGLCGWRAHRAPRIPFKFLPYSARTNSTLTPLQYRNIVAAVVGAFGDIQNANHTPPPYTSTSRCDTRLCALMTTHEWDSPARNAGVPRRSSSRPCSTFPNTGHGCAFLGRHVSGNNTARMHEAVQLWFASTSILRRRVGSTWRSSSMKASFLRVDRLICLL